MDPICREPISGETRVREGRHIEQTQWCGLPAKDWCASCDYPVCSDHLNSRHDRHSRSLLPLSEANADSAESIERRSGVERRKTPRGDSDE